MNAPPGELNLVFNTLVGADETPPVWPFATKVTPSSCVIMPAAADAKFPVILKNVVVTYVPRLSSVPARKASSVSSASVITPPTTEARKSDILVTSLLPSVFGMPKPMLPV